MNAAGGKIGAVELPAVTQLFTEPYMVKFILHNTLGAWWAGKVLARNLDLARDAADENELREASAIPGLTWDFLRFVRDNEGNGPWRPAAGTFPGWPAQAAEITYCDPCCGSGHFLVEALKIFTALRQKEEATGAAEAAAAVLRDNLHGLELDGRCVQIAAFNVALAAWKLAGAPNPLPRPHIAWVGAPPPMARAEMASLADGDVTLRHAMEALYDQFAQAQLLGSLLKVGARDLLDAELRDRSYEALLKLRGAGPEQMEGAVAARGLLDAYNILARKFVLIATNVPFLGRGKQSSDLATFIARNFDTGKPDIATAMLQRLIAMGVPGGSIATVTPQNWLFAAGYRKFRKKLLSEVSINFLALLGEGAWEEFGQRGPKATLTTLTLGIPNRSTVHFGLDANTIGSELDKDIGLIQQKVSIVKQISHSINTDHLITIETLASGQKIKDSCVVHEGLHTGDYPAFGRQFWEIVDYEGRWAYQQSGTSSEDGTGGCDAIILWEGGAGRLVEQVTERLAPLAISMWIKGIDAWNKEGFTISTMRDLKFAEYHGALFTHGIYVITTPTPQIRAALRAFLESGNFTEEVRKLDRRVAVSRSAIENTAFDLSYWEAVALKRYPIGLPKPYSDDPTQWLFHGNPAFAEPGTELHVALARVAGYKWPAETDGKMILSDLAEQRIALAAALPDADADGLLPLHAQGSDLSLADRLRALLAAAYGTGLSPTREQALVRSADAKLDKKDARNATLEAWLRDRAFRQHCILFHQRPFLWQIWDGMNDGFSAFLHYHRLDDPTLGALTYTLLGDWIRTAKAQGQTARQQRAEQLQQKLAKIIEGEVPYDIFVRWKSAARQPMGWDPDLDDGVRLNIRPFMIAGVLRDQPTGINWNKDRGGDVASAPWYDLGLDYGGKVGDRINDHHTTLAEKRAARGIG